MHLLSSGTNHPGGEERTAAEPAQVTQGGPRQHQRRSGTTYKDMTVSKNKKQSFKKFPPTEETYDFRQSCSNLGLTNKKISILLIMLKNRLKMLSFKILPY